MSLLIPMSISCSVKILFPLLRMGCIIIIDSKLCSLPNLQTDFQFSTVSFVGKCKESFHPSYIIIISGSK